MTKIQIIAVVVISVLMSILAVAAVLMVGRSSRPPATPPSGAGVVTPATDSASPSRAFAFQTPKKSAHFETSTPSHGSVLAAGPILVVIDFNFDLAKKSAITITREEKEFSAGPTTIDTNLLAMRRTMTPDAADGLYTVAYSACWPDGSCHDGHFQFAIDRSQAAAYQDLTDKKVVTINLANIAFTPRELRIRAGTTVRWTNTDAVTHYVNTDSHPAHTYYAPQNSKALAEGDTFEVTFPEPGIYPYHCSAHAANMRAVIVVEK